MKLKRLLVLLLLVVSAFVLSACGKLGEAGLQGPKGDKGETGDTGAQGEKGPTGDKGATGENGADGLAIEFSFTSEGIAWNYKGSTEKTVGVTFKEILGAMTAANVDSQIEAELAKLDFDYFVDSSLAKKNNGDAVTAYGKSFVMGTSAFAKVSEAIAAANEAAKVEGYTGLTVFVNAGKQEDELPDDDTVAFVVTAPNLTLLGNNYNRSYADHRGSETIYSTRLDVRADNFTFNGFKVQNGFQLRVEGEDADHPVELSNISAIYNELDGIGTKYDGFVSVIEGNKVTNLTVSYNHADEDGRYNSYRFIRAATIENLDASFNDLYCGGAFYDFLNIRTMIKGKVVMNNNRVINSQQSFIWTAGVGVLDAQIEGNYFEEIVGTVVDFRDMKESGDSVVSVKYNTFVHAGYDWRSIRVRTAGYVTNTATVKVYVENNKFLGTETVVNLGTEAEPNMVPTFMNNPVDGGYTAPIYVVGRNFYQLEDGTVLTAVTNDNFGGAAEEGWGEPYATEEEVPAQPQLVKQFTDCKYNTYVGAPSDVYFSDPDCAATAWRYYTKVVLVADESGNLTVSEIIAAGQAKPETYAWLITACDASQADHPEFFEGIEVGMMAVVDKEARTVSFYK